MGVLFFWKQKAEVSEAHNSKLRSRTQLATQLPSVTGR